MNKETPDAAELGIDAEDMGIAREIMDFDPVYDVKGPTSVQGNVKLPTELSLSALAPEKQAAIREQLATTPQHMKPSEESRLVHEALYQNSFLLRVKGGGGPDATPYQAASMEIANERETANQDALRIAARLAEVRHWKPVTDPVTGKQSQVAVNVIEGDSRVALENELARISHKIEELDGGEGERRLKAALRDSVERRKGLEEQVRILHKAKKRAGEIEEEERVEKQAAAFRSMKRDHLI